MTVVVTVVGESWLRGDNGSHSCSSRKIGRVTIHYSTSRRVCVSVWGGMSDKGTILMT